MRAENGRRAGRYFRQIIDEHRALAPQLLDDMAIMDDLVADIDRALCALERALDHVDRAHHPGAKAPRLGEHDMQAGFDVASR